MHAVQKSFSELKLHMKQDNEQSRDCSTEVHKSSRGHEKALRASISSHTGHLLHSQRMNHFEISSH